MPHYWFGIKLFRYIPQLCSINFGSFDHIYNLRHKGITKIIWKIFQCAFLHVGSLCRIPHIYMHIVLCLSTQGLVALHNVVVYLMATTERCTVNSSEAEKLQYCMYLGNNRANPRYQSFGTAVIIDIVAVLICT